MKVFSGIETHGLGDTVIAVVDGLKGVPEALGALRPDNHAPDLHRAPDSKQL
jgi:transposase-like protein